MTDDWIKQLYERYVERYGEPPDDASKPRL
jgi:hypothetical protein